MQIQELEITEINLPELEGDDAVQLNDLRNKLRLERTPDDPPIPLQEDLQGWRNIPNFVELKYWAVWDAAHTQMVANAFVESWNKEDNQHLAEFEIYVRPEYRRQGLGKRLLRLAAEETRRRSRRLLICFSSSTLPSAEACLQLLEAQRGLEARESQLVLEELDRQVVQDWLKKSSPLNEEYEIGFWLGPYPENQLEAICELYLIGNDEPRDLLEIEDETWTPEQVRSMEKHREARGTERWTCYVRHKSSGRFAGETEVFYNPNRAHILGQGFTGIHPDFRCQGLGRWIKAVMMEKVLAERPQVKVIRTGNAESNASMLKINTELGFKPYLSHTVWQVETDQLFSYLGS